MERLSNKNIRSIEKFKMDKYIVIANNPYKSLKLDGLIDSFEKNCRCNMAMPNNNNGTKYFDQYLNTHVYDKFLKEKWDYDFCKRENKYYLSRDDHLKRFSEEIRGDKFRNIYRQEHHSNKPFNNLLSKIKSPFLFKKNPRLGLEAIFRNLDSNVELYATCFSIKKDEPLNSLTHARTETSDCHDKNSEIDILIWLHENNHIDATFCALEDEEVPVIDCSIIKPKKNSLDLIWEEYGEIHLKLGEERQRIIKDKE